MSRLLSAALSVVVGFTCLTAQASSVTIDFEEFSLGTTSVGPFDSNGYRFQGISFPGPIPDGLPSEIVTGDSGTNSLETANWWAGQDGYGAEASMSMKKIDGGAFAISSLDLLLYGGVSTAISGTLAGGGIADLSVAVGTGDWLNLELVTFSASGGGFGFFEEAGAQIQLDNVSVSAVPVPAAVWLFGSALAGLGWMRRKQTV